MKIILHGEHNLSGQVLAVEYAKKQRELKDFKSKVIGVKVSDKYYSIRFNKNSISVWPND